MSSVLLPGQQLIVGQQLSPATGRTSLIMQTDGNLVLYRVDNSVALWASNTWGQPVTHTIMQTDGNLVCYDNAGHAHWATGTNGNPGAWLFVQDDGNLVVYSATNAALWASNTVQTWPLMPAVQNVSLVRETSSPAVYLIVGNTKFWITDTNEFNTLGFDWSKVRILVDGTLANFTEQRLHAAPAIRPSDVFFDCGDQRNQPPWFGTFYGNCKPSSSIVRKDVLIAGWLRQRPGEEPVPFVNYTGPGQSGIQGLEDIHYNLFLDAVFVNRMYGLNGLSTALSAAVWPGNPPASNPIRFATDAAITPGGPMGASFNSWILPANDQDVHPELNSWHVNDTNPNTLFTVHWRGRGQQPAFWVNPLPQDNDAWFPFNPLDPEGLGYPLQNNDYIVMRGTIWEENNHAIGTGNWSSAPTVGFDGYTEMHPPDWIVRVREPNTNARITTGRTAPASPGTSGPQINASFSIPPDFALTSPTGKLQVRSVQRLVDARFTNQSTVSALGEQVAATQDSVNVTVIVQPTGGQQARFKGSWLVGWREIDVLDQIWVDDQTPAGATLQADGESWDWQSDNVFSGTLAHLSALKQGIHQHYFVGAPNPITVNYLDTLVAMVFLDPDNPPDEVMLQWHTTDWLSRAYWGANLIAWGNDGTTQRHFMGPLPPAGEWVRLMVPAQAVGINGAVDGIAFTLYNGRATWDYAGLNKSSILQ